MEKSNMFLAWKEIKHSKGKFSLIISVIVLITYLVYFLTSLAYGLASSYTNGISNLAADSIVLTEESNDNPMMSAITEEKFGELTFDGEKAKLGITPVVIKNERDNTKINAYIFGVEIDSFIAKDKISELNNYEAVVDSSLSKKGYNIGDNVKIVGIDHNVKIIAFNDKSTYQTAPIIYTTLLTFRDIRYGSHLVPLFNAIVIKGNFINNDSTLKQYTINEYINTLPGYGAQVATFSIMIGFLIVICSFVLGIFIYVLTTQKTSMFGVMKAQGISSFYIGKSVIFQTLILIIIGILIGFALTLATGFGLGSKIPFAPNYIFYLGITLAFILFAILGALFSVKIVLKIDPLKAIS